MNDKQVKFDALVENESFLEAMKAAEGKDDIKRIFSEFGLDLSKDEINAFTAMTERALSEELTADDLESVAGGAIDIDPFKVFEWAWKGTKKIAKKCWNAGRKFANWEQNR